jgi:hypothetical protein
LLPSGQEAPVKGKVGRVPDDDSLALSVGGNADSGQGFLFEMRRRVGGCFFARAREAARHGQGFENGRQRAAQASR